MDLKLEFLHPSTITETQIEQVIHVISKSFKDFNVSVGAPTEVIEEEFGLEEIGPMVIRGMCMSYEGYAAVDDNGNGKIVGLTFADVHAKGSRVANLGPVASLAPGAGKMTFVATCAHVEKLGFSTLILMQVAANPRSFSLYAKLGFEAKHTSQYVGGFLEQPDEDSGEGDSELSLKDMVAEDIEECAQLFLAAHGSDCGWDRTADITGQLGSGVPFPMLVARDASGAVVGYTTGFYMPGHTVAKSQDVFCAIFKECSKIHQQRGLPCPRFSCPVEFSSLLSWALAQKGLKILRANIIMAKGHYEHTPWPHPAGFVVAPSVSGY